MSGGTVQRISVLCGSVGAKKCNCADRFIILQQQQASNEKGGRERQHRVMVIVDKANKETHFPTVAK